MTQAADAGDRGTSRCAATLERGSRAPRAAPGRSRERRIAALLVGAAAFLLFEVRFEHREVLSATWRSWIPLVYCGLTLGAGAITLLRWHTWGRRALGALFALGIVVGFLGLWFHTGGHPLGGIGDVLGAWGIPLGQNGGIKIGSRPPALAPLAFCGLGALGVMVCAALPPGNSEA